MVLVYIISDNTSNTLTFNKSKFIAFLYKVSNIEDVNNILSDLKVLYKDASHICYAYIIDNYEKYSDDREPIKTSGYKILEALKYKKLNYTLGVVVRYFGGIKLGYGNLSRCYFNSINDCFNNITLLKLDNNIKLTLKTNIDNVKLLNNICKDVTILNKYFSDTVIYEVLVSNDIKNSFIKSLDNTNIYYEEKNM